MSLPEREARDAICETARDIWQRGLGAAGDGNLSIRLSKDRVLTTPSACHKGRLRPRDLVVTDLQGRSLGPGKASSELALHLEAYRQRPDIGAVIHAHPPMALAWDLAGGRLDEVVVSEVVFAFGTAASAPYTTPTTRDVPDVLGRYIACYDVVVMPRHGSVTVGPSLDAAFIKLDALEHTAKVLCTARLLGGGQPLPDAEVERLFALAFGGATPAYREASTSCPAPARDASDTRRAPPEPAVVAASCVPCADEAIVQAVLASIRGAPR